MARDDPATELDARYGDAPEPTPWPIGRSILESSRRYWLTTVRPEARPHVTPLYALWHDGAMWFCTGADERKGRNLDSNPHCVLTTATSADDDGGLDVVVEADAVRVTDASCLRIVADAWEAKYGPDWHWEIEDGSFAADGRQALVYELAPVTAFGFGTRPFSQTRWRF
jgi:general stress protein 26